MPLLVRAFLHVPYPYVKFDKKHVENVIDPI